MDWRSVLEKYRSQLGWLALAGVALLAVKKDNKWPPDPPINYGGSLDPHDLDAHQDRIVMWNFEGKQVKPQVFPSTHYIDIGSAKPVPIKIIPTQRFIDNWYEHHARVENDHLGLIGRLPSMALAGIRMSWDKVAASHKKRLGGSEVEPKLTGRVKYTSTRVKKANMIGGSGRLAMPFHEAIIIFEVYRYKNGSFEMELIKVLPREARGRFKSQYTEMQSPAWPDNARIDPISGDPNEVPRPTYGLWLHEPITPANAGSRDSIEWLEGNHEQGGNFSRKQWKKSATRIGIQAPSARPSYLQVDKEWANMKPKPRSNSWNELCRVCPALEQSDEGQKIAAIRRLKKEKKYTKKQERIALNDTTLLGWGRKEVQKYVDENCWI
tara:strand:+ start:31 stop:1173 length:1143 start_codon:yes stop_codon:yes gene_type:complete